MTIGDVIKNYREEHDISQRQFAQLCGMSNGYISILEDGKHPKTNEPVVPTISTMRKLALAMNISLSDLMSIIDDTKVVLSDEPELPSNIFPISVKRFPILGEIACGEPIYADEDHESYILANSNIKADFCLLAKGDSMINARINDGDVVFIHSQPTVENGEIAAVIIGDEATLKRVYIKANVVTLVAENPKYEPMVYAGEELENIRILGKAVCFMSNL